MMADLGLQTLDIMRCCNLTDDEILNYQVRPGQSAWITW